MLGLGWKTNVCVIAIGAIATVGCHDDAKETGTHEPSTTAAEPIAAPVLMVPTPKQETRFVDAVMTAAHRGDPATFNALIDWDALAHRAARNLQASTAVLAGVVSGAKQGCVNTGVCASLAAVGQGKAKLRDLGPIVVNGERWVTFRRMPTEGGFDHIRFLLSADAQGNVRATDVFVLSLGEASSETLRRALLPMLATDAERVRRMQGSESAFARHGAEITRAQELATAGKANEALAVLSQLPAVLHNDPFVMAQRVTISRLSGDQQAYLSAIDELAARHPNEPITVLNQLDAYALRQRFTDAVTVIGRIEAMVTPDPYLDVLRSNLQTSAGFAIDAAATAKRAIAREPELPEAYVALLSATLKQPDYAETTRTVLALRKNFGLNLQLEGVPDYAGYVASPEYAKLKAALAIP